MTTSGVLLDTCAVIWLLGGLPMSDASRAAIADAASNDALYVSPISAWEIGMLVAKGRIALSLPVTQWVEKAFAQPGMQTADLMPAILVFSSFLPGTAPGDPADRIIIATARQHGVTIVTRDRPIIDYAQKGYVHALEC